MSTTQDAASRKHDFPTTLPIVEEAAATGEVAHSYADYRARFGRPDVPGILKCFATHPPLLQQMIDLASSLLFIEGHLTRRTKEMIATYVSALNACPYCIDSHAFSLRTQGGSDDLLSALVSGNLEAPSISTKDRQLLRFVRQVTNESYKVAPADIRQLNNVGWEQQQITEATHITALFAFFNRVVNTFGLPSQHHLDFDFASTQSKESR